MAIFLYILRSEKNGHFYTGIAADVGDRLKRHNSGRSISTKSGRTWQLVHTEEFPDRSSAMKRESEIKSWKSHAMIEKLIEKGSNQTKYTLGKN